MSDDNFDVNIPPIVSELKDGTTIVTDSNDKIDVEKILRKEFENSALDFNQQKHTYSRYLGGTENSTDNSLTLSDIDTYAENPQNNLQNIKKINSIVKQYVNKDDIIGKINESVQIYTNTQYSLKYPTLITDKNKNKNKLEKIVKPLIESFNAKVDIKNFINVGTSTAFLEGNFISYLRTDPKSGKAVIDFYPLSIIEITEYNVDGEPAVLFNVNELRSKLRVNSRKKKNGKDIFYDKVDEIVKNNYPKEVYDAYKNNEKYALLNQKRIGVVRINNLGGLYGLTPIFKALKPALMLENIENADETIVRVRAKKIVHQKLRKEVSGTDYAKQALTEMAYAHTNLVNAWKNKTVLVTTPWYVESISYISDNTPLTDTDTLKAYRSRVFNALGINFMDTEANLNLSNVSVKDLMKTIDKIAESLSAVINKYYKLLLEENNIDITFAPEIQIASSETLSIEMRKTLAEFLFTKLGASYDTSYNILGISDANTEAIKRTTEKEQGYDEVFIPHANYFTTTTNNDGTNTNNTNNTIKEDNNGGRPKSKVETKKQKYDSVRNESKVE